ncbi:hypothetical protein [Teredinibacter turnerae]|uniref:hypothetical protein n=1 Tax=Teredinibacter turnerae TaxID=2426 RepID=UPI0012BC790F|nr:hypothetical protein [Teredinibacter turnerae]
MKLSYIFLLFLSLSYRVSADGISPSSIEWLPESLKKIECKIPGNTQLPGDVVLKVQGIVVGQFAQSGQHDIAMMCGDRIYIHWGGPQKCEGELIAIGDSLGIPAEGEVERYLARYKNNAWPSELSHDPLSMYYFGKSSFYKYCHKGNWLSSDGAD